MTEPGDGLRATRRCDRGAAEPARWTAVAQGVGDHRLSDIWHLEAHHSTALEGNTLVLREVEALLGEGRAVGAKPLKEYMEVKGYADAARWVYGQALEPDEWSDGDLISLNELRRIHHMAMTPSRGGTSHRTRRPPTRKRPATSAGTTFAPSECPARISRRGELQKSRGHRICL